MLNSRIALANSSSTSSYGTVRFVGALPHAEATQGDWLGVEWDDPARGKHSGVYVPTGERYFDCLVAGAGSFIRPALKGLQRGRSFASALQSKYDSPASSPSSSSSRFPAAAEQIESTFYTTSSNFSIEVVHKSGSAGDRRRGMDKLKEIGLEGEGVATAGVQEEEMIMRGLENLHTLNLSQSLLSDLEELDRIIDCIPSLRILLLNSNRFTPLPTPTPRLLGMRSLTTLHMNNTMIAWSEIVLLAASLPSLVELQLGSNRMTSMPSALHHSAFPALKSINLENNMLSSWDELRRTLGALPSLETLVLSSNRISTIITTASPARSSLDRLRSLSLASNLIASWDSLSTLTQLEELCIADNPLVAGMTEDAARQHIVSRLPALKLLEGSFVSAAEIARSRKVVSESTTKSKKDSLLGRSSRLLRLRISLPPSLSPAPLSAPLILSVLPTLSIRSLRSKILKALDPATIATISIPKDQFRFIAVLSNASSDAEKSETDVEEEVIVEIPLDEESRELRYWGIEDGDEIRVRAIQ